MSYDNWKTTNPDDEWLGPEPQTDEERERFDYMDRVLRSVKVRYDLKPIPSRDFDWEATAGDYDLGDPIGYGATEQDAVTDLLMIIESNMP